MPLTYKAQTHFAKVLETAQQNLFAKNYAERMIGSFANPGTFINDLKHEMEQVVNDNFWEKRRTEFQVTMTGYFGRSRSKIDFRFNYLYNPYGIKFDLKSLIATINDDITKIYYIKTTPSRDLPMAGYVAKDLGEILDRKILEKVKAQEKLLKQQSKRKL